MPLMESMVLSCQGKQPTCKAYLLHLDTPVAYLHQSPGRLAKANIPLINHVLNNTRLKASPPDIDERVTECVCCLEGGQAIRWGKLDDKSNRGARGPILYDRHCP